MTRTLPTALALCLAACAAPPPPAGPVPGQARADAARIAACRDRADATYSQQNRGAIYTGSDETSTPLSAGYVSGNTARGLGDRFAQENAYDACIRAR